MLAKNSGNIFNELTLEVVRMASIMLGFGLFNIDNLPEGEKNEYAKELRLKKED